MSRRARPSARTTRTAPTAPCVPVSPRRRSLCLARSRRSRGQSPGIGSCTSVEGGSERSTGSPGGPHSRPSGPRSRRPARRPVAGPRRRDRARRWRRWRSTASPTRTAATTTSCGRRRPSSRATPRSAIRSRRATALLGNALFQDVLPIPTTDGVPRALLPFPPLPAVVLLPFVALWGLATNDQVDLHGPRRGRRGDLLVGASGGCRSRRSCASRRRCSSPSGRCSGTPPSSRRPGTRRTSWRSG